MVNLVKNLTDPEGVNQLARNTSYLMFKGLTYCPKLVNETMDHLLALTETTKDAVFELSILELDSTIAAVKRVRGDMKSLAVGLYNATTTHLPGLVVLVGKTLLLDALGVLAEVEKDIKGAVSEVRTETKTFWSFSLGELKELYQTVKGGAAMVKNHDYLNTLDNLPWAAEKVTATLMVPVKAIRDEVVKEVVKEVKGVAPDGNFWLEIWGKRWDWKWPKFPQLAPLIQTSGNEANGDVVVVILMMIVVLLATILMILVAWKT